MSQAILARMPYRCAVGVRAEPGAVVRDHPACCPDQRSPCQAWCEAQPVAETGAGQACGADWGPTSGACEPAWAPKRPSGLPPTQSRASSLTGAPITPWPRPERRGICTARPDARPRDPAQTGDQTRRDTRGIAGVTGPQLQFLISSPGSA
jgi:hypothetical protein